MHKPLVLATALLAFCIAGCSKTNKTPDTTPAPPVVVIPDPPAVIVNDIPDNGKDTLGSWASVSHWDLAELYNFQAISFPAGDTGYITDVAPVPTSVYTRTTDGGKTWSAKKHLITNNEYNYMIDGSNGIGYRTTDGTVGGSNIYLTVFGSSGISSFRTLAVATLLPPQVHAIHFPSRNFGYLTTTAGATYRMDYPLDKDKFKLNETDRSPDDINSMFFTSNSSGWICTAKGGILFTSDSAKTFTSQLKAGTNISFTKIFFTDPDYGWASTQTNLFYKTTDGGKNWVKITVPGVTTSRKEFVFTNRTRGFFIAGRDIYESNDGGNTWKRSCKMGKEYFNSITWNGKSVFALSTGSEFRTTPLQGGGTQSTTWTFASVVKIN